MSRKQAIVSPSPAAASVTVQLVQLVSVAESHGLKKAVQRFLLICFLGFETVVFSTVSSYLDTIRNNWILLFLYICLAIIGFWCIIEV